MTLEIAVFNIGSALLAVEAGADRLELCENPYDGGTTPSYGTLKLVREKVNTPVFPIIRPRGGDFLFSDDEFEVMQKDIELCKSMDYDGVVIGLLKNDGSVDVERTMKLVELAYPLEVTFHRAFDRAKYPLQALEDIIACGCHRILTSGQVPNAFDAKDLVKQLVDQADERIIIMPGSGVRAANIHGLASFTGAKELHSSARKLVASGMLYQQKSMAEDLSLTSVDAEEVRQMKAAIALLEDY